MIMLKIEDSRRSKKQTLIDHMSIFTTSASSKVWETQERYLKKNMIRAIIECIGHDEKEEDAKRMLSHAQRELSNEMTRMIQTTAALDIESEDKDEDGDEYYF
jgi:hypothetical protein